MSETPNLNMKNVPIIGFCSFLIFLSSLFVNFLQLINYLTIRYINIDYYRYINRCLQFVIYSQIVAIAEWWSASTLNIYFGDEKSKKLFGNEHVLAVSNHRYEVDFVFMWMCAKKFNTLGSAKAFGKKELRKVPIIGWTFFFGEYIFLERNWEKDQKNIGMGLDRLMEHKNNICLMIAAEGTRFTPEKYRASRKFAEEKQLNVHYKYHLLPRVKGFAYSIRHLKKNHSNCSLVNMQLAFDEEVGAGVSTSSLIRGYPMKGSIYLKRIDLNDIPTDTDEQITKYLYELYEEKDRLMEYHKQHKKFPGIEVPFRRSVLPLIILFTNFFIFGIPFLYLMVKVFTSANLPLIIITSLFIIAVYMGLYFAIRSAKINKGSTYGTIEGKNSKTKSTLNDTNNSINNGKSNHSKED